jgi:DNA-directed RNA polymerase specialized sigma54-like protein
MILEPRQIPAFTQRMIASQKLLMSPALTSSPGKSIPVVMPTRSVDGARLVKEVSRLIKAEQASTPLSDRDILSRVQLKLKDTSLSTQSIARARFKLGIPPSARRHR